ncbi:MAG: hypothetical protein LBN27_10495 [Prevotellaceae bacterium]|jgi:thioredoxin-like negative regulator of GroEL|nr:hypothetical protein [Prevotellaceae bacterium]
MQPLMTTQRNIQTETKAEFSLGYLLMKNEQYVDALFFWLSQQEKENAVIQYNTALCYFFAKDFSQAKANIELCIRNIKIQSYIQRNTAINQLLETEAQSTNYLNPLLSASLTLCPELVLLRANRLLYDICVQMGDVQTAQRIADTLANKRFSNIN